MLSMDGHCDVLWRMWEQKGEPASFYSEDSYDVTYSRLQKAKVRVEWFALFIPPDVPAGQRLKEILKQIDLFYLHIIGNKQKMVSISSMKEVAQLQPEQCAAFLHLEGVDGLEGELKNVRLLHRLGVRQVGLTWNHANEAADGIDEQRGGGLTNWGRALVAELARLNMILDVSHLSVQGFWEVVKMHIPVVASHSNCQRICPHRRNLNDEQITAIIKKKGLIGLNFVPFFLNRSTENASIHDLITHIDHICSLGGQDQIYFGSDFDGSSKKLKGLEHMGKWNQLVQLMLKRYPHNWVQNWLWGNAVRFYDRYLK
ncbi:membrane dipeptidase [Seinonella peptonophila]|uniref:Membrane dipeptidase n=1 Tax=Seinonella peptonophila TaxID=112248 RepID=A0A1M4T9Q0_9BACL|nr:dipeptidase [Seinonella peptonophila]SHE41239.1 membrane dipeptidase [Seinonella peptonophila]